MLQFHSIQFCFSRSILCVKGPKADATGANAIRLNVTVKVALNPGGNWCFGSMWDCGEQAAYIVKRSYRAYIRHVVVREAFKCLARGPEERGPCIASTRGRSPIFERPTHNQLIRVGFDRNVLNYDVSRVLLADGARPSQTQNASERARPKDLSARDIWLFDFAYEFMCVTDLDWKGTQKEFRQKSMDG